MASLIDIFLSIFRPASAQVPRLRQGVQAQASLDRAQATPLRREALPVPEMSQAILALGLVLTAHQPQVLLLQAVPGSTTATTTVKLEESQDS